MTTPSRPTAFPPWIAGHTLLPSNGLALPRSMPAASMSVGNRSITDMSCVLFLPAGIAPGQRIAAATRMPPSYTLPLPFAR